MEINAKDAKEMGVHPGDPLVADFGQDSIRASAKISRLVPPGVLRIWGPESRVRGVKVRRDV